MIPAEIVRQVRRIQVRTGRQVADLLAGEYLSVFKGRGMEFDEVRPYVPGDDVRTIDWNVTARHGAPYVKRFVEERELTVLLLVDVSPSMSFGSKHRSKREAATELSALIAFSAIQNDDKIGLLLFHGGRHRTPSERSSEGTGPEGPEKFIPPRKGQRHALRVIREVLARSTDEPAPRSSVRGVKLGSFLERLKLPFSRRAGPRSSARGTNVGAAVEHARRAMRRRAVIFVISDFIDDGFLTALRAANRRHDVVCVLVTDARELEPVDTGLLTLEDAETGRVAVCDTSSAVFQGGTRAAALARTKGLESALRSAGIDLVSIDATRSVVEPLVQFLRMRQRRSRR
jgi:uncharacterized protein (DUF58 family)